MGVYRSSGYNPLRERLVDAGLGTILGLLVALILWTLTVAAWAQWG